VQPTSPLRASHPWEIDGERGSGRVQPLQLSQFGARRVGQRVQAASEREQKLALPVCVAAVDVEPAACDDACVREGACAVDNVKCLPQVGEGARVPLVGGIPLAGVAGLVR